MSVSLHVLEGRYDDALEWPMKRKFQVEILNQEQDKSHLTSNITLEVNHDIFNVSQVCSGQVGEVIRSSNLYLTSSDPYIIVKDTMYT